ncbi:MAG: DUF1353 domain-containing protein [Verrucomicrobiales bacterium]|nr:DUF1353 domain-containing protein [Verrucomicrobiales bacterium]MCP5559917.1 DUF1353 domain-containing protein [Verrucomicrobiaceae bacterium]
MAGLKTTGRLEREAAARLNSDHAAKFQGEAKFLWVSPNLFWFEQAEDSRKALRYITVHPRRPTQQLIIEPEDMFFDGASVPRWLWEVDSLGPFDFTYAALVHDWIFEAHHRYEIYANAEKSSNTPAALKPRFKAMREKYEPYSSANMSLEDAGWIYAECIHLEMERAGARIDYLNQVRATELKNQNKGELGANNLEGIDRLMQSVDISAKRRHVLGFHRWATSSLFAKGIYDPKSKKSLHNRSPHTSTTTTVLALLEGGKDLTEQQKAVLVNASLLERFRKVAALDKGDAPRSVADLPTTKEIKDEPLQEARMLKAAMQFYDAALEVQ